MLYSPTQRKLSCYYNFTYDAFCIPTSLKLFLKAIKMVWIKNISKIHWMLKINVPWGTFCVTEVAMVSSVDKVHIIIILSGYVCVGAFVNAPNCGGTHENTQ